MSNSPLTRERILRAALRIVDSGGLDGLSMRKLGTRLGVKGTALYHHFASKSDIIDALIAMVMKDIDLADDESNWVRRIRRALQSQRQVMLAHPNLVCAIALRPFSTPESARSHNTLLGILMSAGLDDETTLHGYQTLRAFVVGYALTETAGLLAVSGVPESSSRLSIKDFADHGLSQLVDIIPIAAHCDRDEDFTLGLEAILTGLQTESLRRSLRLSRGNEPIG